MILYNTFYRSNEQSHVRFVEGERKIEPYFLYYLFREDGVWMCKTTSESHFELEDFLGSVDMAEITFDPDHSEPMDENRELKYQCGKYKIQNETVYCSWKNKHLDDEKGREWYFRIRSKEVLSTDFEEIILHPVR